MASGSDTKLAQTSSGTLLSWLPWGSGKPKAPQSASTDVATQQPQQGAQAAAAAETDASQSGDGVPDFNGQWEKDTAASDMDAYAKQVAMLHMSR